MKRLQNPLAVIGAVVLTTLTATGQPPDSTEAMGQKFAEPKSAESIRVLLAGAGSSHDFPRYFLGSDAETLRKAGGLDVAATPNLNEALELLPQADVLVFSGNHDQWGRGSFQTALRKHADAGKGVVILHAGAWIHPWDGYNERFVGGGSTGHGFGDFSVTVKKPDHAIMKGVPADFTIRDESYHHRFGPNAKAEVLAENHADGKTHASVWVVEDPKAPMVCITLGHAAEAHENGAYRKILVNAVKWAAAGR
jgi:trehalose utilization protein